MKCRYCGSDTNDIEVEGLGWMHYECEILRLNGLLKECYQSSSLQIAREALEKIASYDDGSKFGEGICYYGCDSPSIAKAALERMGK